MKIIGLYGQQRAGKSFVAQGLVDGYDWSKASFATPLREVVNTIFGEDWTKNGEVAYGLTGRDLLQKIGSFGRAGIDKNIWLDSLFKRAEGCDMLVIDDLRYDNEAMEIIMRGGKIVRVSNPELPVQNDPHASEQDWPQWIPDLTVQNSYGTDTSEICNLIHNL